MKAIYETPAVELIKFAAMETIADDNNPDVTFGDSSYVEE